MKRGGEGRRGPAEKYGLYTDYWRILRINKRYKATLAVAFNFYEMANRRLKDTKIQFAPKSFTSSLLNVTGPKLRYFVQRRTFTLPFLAIFRKEITTIMTPSTSEGGEWGSWG